jgi:hypothetical protein
MPYIEETCEAGQTLEICRYFTYRIHTKGEKREPRGKPTPEAQKRVNQRKAETELRRLMNANFRDGDFLVRLDFFKQNAPPGSKEMQELVSKAMRKLKDAVKRDGIDLKYLYVKEVGPRGGRHIHAMLTKIDPSRLQQCWPHGGIHIDPLNSGGQYRRIAAYFIKYALRTEETEGKLIGKRWYSSRNLVRPKAEKEVIQAKRFREEPKTRKGYTLEKESVKSGISEFTGYAYLSYTLIKNREEGGENEGRRHLHRDKPAGPRKGKGKGDVPDERKKGGRDAPRAAAADRGV